MKTCLLIIKRKASLPIYYRFPESMLISVLYSKTKGKKRRRILYQKIPSWAVNIIYPTEIVQKYNVQEKKNN